MDHTLKQYPILMSVFKSIARRDHSPNFLHWITTHQTILPFVDLEQLQQDIDFVFLYHMVPSSLSLAEKTLHVWSKLLLWQAPIKPEKMDALWMELTSLQHQVTTLYIHPALRAWSLQTSLSFKDYLSLHEYVMQVFPLELKNTLIQLQEHMKQASLGMSLLTQLEFACQHTAPPPYKMRKNNPVYQLLYDHKEHIAQYITTVHPHYYLFPEETGNVFRLKPAMFHNITLPPDYLAHFQKAGFLGNLRDKDRTRQWVDALFSTLNDALYTHYQMAERYIDITGLPFENEYRHAVVCIHELGVTPFEYFREHNPTIAPDETALYL